MMDVDGSQGEGGGQVLRTALALSLCTLTPVRVVKVRAGRSRPGLMRQHLTAVQAAARVGQASVEGDAVGSTELTFCPTRVQPGSFHFPVGTAGSATLVLQTVLPALLTAEGPSSLVLEGGTHNPLAPPFDFLADAFLPLLERQGPRVQARLLRHGFYPAGGGKLEVAVQPVAALAPLELLERGDLQSRDVRVLVSRLPGHVAQREVQVLRERLGWSAAEVRPELVTDSPGPGNVLVAHLRYAHVTEVFTAFGEKGVPGEQVAEALVRQVLEYQQGGAPVGEHLADQLVLPLALAGGGRFRTTALSSHARTQVELVPRFLPVRVEAQDLADGQVEVRVLSR